MQDSKSLHQALPGLASCLIDDFVTTYPHLSFEFKKDLRKISKRLSSEGPEFMTKTMPRFWSAILAGLETGCYILPFGFTRDKNSKLPLMFKGLLSLVFSYDGSLLPTVDENALAFLSQFCQIVYKFELPYKQETADKAIQNFKTVDSELGKVILPDYDPILEEANSIVLSILSGIDPKEIRPKHGTGAVATGEKSFRKWEFKRLYKSAHNVYPYYEYFLPSRSTLFDPSSIRWYRNLERLDFATSKFMLVPKDSRGPRSINMEPLELMFLQQGLMNLVVKKVQSSPFGHQILFNDQGTNQRLALASSQSRELATLDMKEASDRVSVALVKRLFSGTGLLKYLLGTRSSHSCLPTGEIIKLNKFAPMGSAMCFPVEAICFFALAEAVRREWRIPGEIHVFGDDLIVPKRLASYLFDLFPNYGLKFNENKCFLRGYFRESCGVDAYNGIDITPIKLKKTWPRSSNNRDANRIKGAVDSINNLYLRGFWNTAEYLRKLFSCTYKIKLPYTPASMQFTGLSWLSYQDTVKGTRSRFDKATQSVQYQSYQYFDKKVRERLSSSSRLFKNLLGLNMSSFKITDLNSLTSKTVDPFVGSVPVPHAGHLKLRWCSLRSMVV